MFIQAMSREERLPHNNKESWWNDLKTWNHAWSLWINLYMFATLWVRVVKHEKLVYEILGLCTKVYYIWRVFVVLFLVQSMISWWTHVKSTEFSSLKWHLIRQQIWAHELYIADTPLYLTLSYNLQRFIYILYIESYPMSLYPDFLNNYTLW